MAAEAGRRLDAYENVAVMETRREASHDITSCKSHHGRDPDSGGRGGEGTHSDRGAHARLGERLCDRVCGVLRPKHSQLEHSQFSAVQGTPKVGPPSHPMKFPTYVVSPRFTQVLLNICACERPARYATKIAKSKAKEGREETSMLKEEESWFESCPVTV